MDWAAGEKNVCSAYACSALRLLGTSSLPTRLLGDSPSASCFATHRIKKIGVWGHNQAKPCKTCHAMQKIVQNELLVSSIYRHTDETNSIFAAQNRAKQAIHPVVWSAPFNYTWSRYNTNDKDDPDDVAVGFSRPGSPPRTWLGARQPAEVLHVTRHVSLLN